MSLIVDLARSDLLLETELLRFAESSTRTAPPGKKHYKMTAASLRSARQQGMSWAVLEAWFEQRTGMPGSPAARFLFGATDVVPLEFRRQIVLHVAAGRHPVLDQVLPPGTFVPNDVRMGPEEGMFLLVTGPNMGGKSIYLRQVALITLIACYLGVLLLPQLAVHQATDFLEPEHAGDALRKDPGAGHPDQRAGTICDLARDTRDRRIRPAHLRGPRGSDPAQGGIAARHERDCLVGRSDPLRCAPAPR